MKKESGKTARTKRRNQRRHAEDQIQLYSKLLKIKYPKAKVQTLIILDETLDWEIQKDLRQYREKLHQKWLEREKITYPFEKFKIIN